MTDPAPLALTPAANRAALPRGLATRLAATPALRRVGPVLDLVAAAGGIGVAAGALAALLISEHTPLFGFMENGYRREIVISIAAEVVAIAALGLFLAGLRRGRS